MAQPKPSVLLIEDDPDERLFFQIAFEAIYPDIKVDAVSGAYEALAYFDGCRQSQLPWLIVVDFDMPLMSGPELLRHLAPIQALAGIPKVMWSSSSCGTEPANLVGAKEFLIKPCSVIEMKSTVKHLESLMQETIGEE